MKTAAAILLFLSTLLVQPLPLDAQELRPVLAVEALGCVLCEAGQSAAFRVNIANPDGAPRTVHLIAQAELPTALFASVDELIDAYSLRADKID